MARSRAPRAARLQSAHVRLLVPWGGNKAV